MYSVLKLGNYLGGYANNPNPASFTDDYSVLLDGVDEYINIDNLQSAISTNTTGTISMWVKPFTSSPASNQMLFCFGDTDATEFIRAFHLSSGVLRFELNNAGTVQWRVTTNAAAFGSGTWTHVCLVVDGVSMPKIYIDSVEVAHTDNVTTDVTQWMNDLSGVDNGRLGCQEFNSSTTFYYDGNINDFLYTSDAKNASAVSDIYNSGTPKDESLISNGVTYYTFENSSDNYNSDVTNEWRFYDSIGSNNADSVNLEEADRELDTP